MLDPVLPPWVVLPPVRNDDGRDAIEAMLAAIEARFATRITLHDRSGILSHPDSTCLLPPTRHSHQHPLCTTARPADHATDRCVAHCARNVNAVVAQRSGSVIHHCWRGGCEIVHPVHRDGRHLFTLFAGVYRGLPEHVAHDRGEQLAAIAATLPELGDPVPLIEMLELAGATILAWADNYRFTRTPDNDRRKAVRDFVTRHLDRDVSLDDLARHLGLSPSRTSHVVLDLFGRSFTDILIAARIARAQAMLTASDLPAAQVAKRCGFSSPFHFSRLFRGRCGLPPGRWRILNRSA